MKTIFLYLYLFAMDNNTRKKSMSTNNSPGRTVRRLDFAVMCCFQVFTLPVVFTCSFTGVHRYFHGGGGAENNRARLLQIPTGQVELFRHHHCYAESG